MAPCKLAFYHFRTSWYSFQEFFCMVHFYICFLRQWPSWGCSWRGVLDTTLCDKDCQWFSPPIKLTATEILWKVVLNTITLNTSWGLIHPQMKIWTVFKKHSCQRCIKMVQWFRGSMLHCLRMAILELDW